MHAIFPCISSVMLIVERARMILAHKHTPSLSHTWQRALEEKLQASKAKGGDKAMPTKHRSGPAYRGE